MIRNLTDTAEAVVVALASNGDAENDRMLAEDLAARAQVMTAAW
jgi:hypothetical protein